MEVSLLAPVAKLRGPSQQRVLAACPGSEIRGAVDDDIIGNEHAQTPNRRTCSTKCRTSTAEGCSSYA